MAKIPIRRTLVVCDIERHGGNGPFWPEKLRSEAMITATEYNFDALDVVRHGRVTVGIEREACNYLLKVVSLEDALLAVVFALESPKLAVPREQASSGLDESALETFTEELQTLSTETSKLRSHWQERVPLVLVSPYAVPYPYTYPRHQNGLSLPEGAVHAYGQVMQETAVRNDLGFMDRRDYPVDVSGPYNNYAKNGLGLSGEGHAMTQRGVEAILRELAFWPAPAAEVTVK